MAGEKLPADRLAAYSDAVFAVTVTIMVLEFKTPDQASSRDLSPLWPTEVSDLFIPLFGSITITSLTSVLYEASYSRG